MNKNIFFLKDYAMFEPYINRSLVQCHYELHHMQYVKNLQNMGIDNYEDVLNNMDKYNERQINNALQIYNHNIFWESMKIDTINNCISQDILNKFINSANSMFGSGWTWLIQHIETKSIDVINTKDAQRPSDSYKILAVLDLWEHAYYLQYYSDRKQFIEIFVRKLLNYDYIATNMI
jgi:Fe-Mn family superoxide dismutase